MPGEGAGEALGAGLLAAGRAAGALAAVPAAGGPALALAQPAASSTAIPVPDTITNSWLATTTAYGGRPLPDPCCRKSIAPCEHCPDNPTAALSPERSNSPFGTASNQSVVA